MKNIFFGHVGKWVRRGVLITMDMALLFVALQIALQLRYDGNVRPSTMEHVIRSFPLMAGVFLSFSVIGSLYGIVWRFVGALEILRMVVVYALSTIVTLVMSQTFDWWISRPVIVMMGICAMILVTASRLLWRLVRETLRSKRSGRICRRILIVGAGEGGAYAARICQQNRAKFGQPVAFVDDDPLKRRMRINGIPVCGRIDEIPEVIRKKEIDEIIVAIPSTKGEVLNRILTTCMSTQCRTRILSDPNELESERCLTLRDLNTSDFMSREEVVLDEESIRDYLTDQVILVTGGGGSIGSEICRQVMRFHPKLLVSFDIYENGAYDVECELRAKYGQDCPMIVLIGSICDKKRLDDVFERYQPKVVFNAAAHKHVPLMEMNPSEAVKNNVFGTRCLLQSAKEHGVERFVQLSTDKAVNPTNIMGATKRITEMLLQQYARNSTMNCIATRFGNVLGSHGSVLPLFDSQIRRGGPLTVTHPDITRYFMTIPEASQLVLQAGGLGCGGAVYVLDMGEPVRIMDLAEKLIRFYGYEPHVDIPIRIIGLRPGEKLHEELMMEDERKHMERTAHDKIFVAPPVPINEDDFDVQLCRLQEASERCDDKAVVRLLVEIVGTYTPDVRFLEG
ncbi:MAG: nucleoside-diphosphate sugar epimerase/dehydratase [Christensenellales bacterium]|nr:nucleoside-diphosphate sugar epimerase/dehydratase [Christensenellales bacterium]